MDESEWQIEWEWDELKAVSSRYNRLMMISVNNEQTLNENETEKLKEQEQGSSVDEINQLTRFKRQTGP